MKNLSNKITTSFQQKTSDNFQIQNYTNTEKVLKVVLHCDELQGGSTLKLCYQGQCITEGDNIIVKINANNESEDFRMELTGGISNYRGSAYIEFIDLKIDKTVTKEISFEVSDRKVQDVFYSKGNISVNSFFPNPAVKSAIMEYQISPYTEGAKITLQNILGSIVATYILSPEENRLSISTEDLDPGVYFYTLSVKDEGLATRKLIVKK